MRDKDNDSVVIKANELIQNFKYKLSKSEMRIVNLIISNIDSPLYDEEFNMMKFSIQDFYNMLGWENVGGKDYERLKNMLKKLSNSSSDYIQIGEKETIVRWIEKPYIYKNKGIVELKIDEDLKPFLLKANGVMKAKLKYYFIMDSKYSMRLYELMKSWDGCKEKKFEIDELREQIDAEQKSYENFGKFHQGVLKPSVEEINEITDIELQYEIIKEGRKVTHIVFKINKKDKKAIPEDNKKQEKDKMFFEMFGLVVQTFPEFSVEEIKMLCSCSLPHLEIAGLSIEEKQDKIIQYIFPKLQKINATPNATKTTIFNRLLNAVENNY